MSWYWRQELKALGILIIWAVLWVLALGFGHYLGYLVSRWLSA